MAGRFIFHNFSSAMLRSTSFLAAHASSSARAAAPSPQAARYFNTGVPSIIFKRMNPAFVGCVRGSKRTFSSGAFSNKEDFLKAKMAEADMRPYAAKLNRDSTTIVLLAGAVAYFLGIRGPPLEVEPTSSNNAQRGSSHCSCCCCKCHGGGPKPNVR
ncbi:hypothetical protein ACP70R_010640 [Stipagrostis hirtigluma subsp. patula]